ncbi:hypothetical protein DdX_15580 [Ditylenchus destructor]|uniref:Uncharacterized protein n=1 Tax=Ditylenchus destructor TaxID=166010 RepID=A0AAD4MRX1_9BILA|nr:hypothetical protein DdX_15580 [Ditylenchus destructor]
MTTSANVPASAPYLNVCQNIAIIGLHFVTISIMSHLVYCLHFKKHSLKVYSLSNCLQVYLIQHIICATIDIPYVVYLVANWKPMDAVYDPYILYWIGLGDIIYFHLSSASVVMLSLDRLLYAKFPLHYANLIRPCMPYIMILAMLSYALIAVFLHLIELPLDLEKVEHCQLFSCLYMKYRAIPQLYMRSAMGAVNVILGTYLLHLLRKCDVAKNIKNRLVIVTMLLDVALNVLPSVFASVFAKITGIASSNYFGQLTALLTVLSVAICAIYYSAVLVKWRKITPTWPNNAVASAEHSDFNAFGFATDKVNGFSASKA